MKSVLRPIFAVTFAAFVAASVSVPVDAASKVVRPSAYDGRWSVVVYTLQGDCDRALRYSLRIVDSRVQGEDQSYQVSGAVARSGAIRVIVVEGGRSASGHGRLTRDSGRGEWRTSTGQCAGQWTAARRASAD